MFKQKKDNEVFGTRLTFATNDYKSRDTLTNVLKKSDLNITDYDEFFYGGIEDGHPRDFRLDLVVTKENKTKIETFLNDLSNALDNRSTLTFKRN